MILLRWSGNVFARNLLELAISFLDVFNIQSGEIVTPNEALPKRVRPNLPRANDLHLRRRNVVRWRNR